VPLDWPDEALAMLEAHVRLTLQAYERLRDGERYTPYDRSDEVRRWMQDTLFTRLSCKIVDDECAALRDIVDGRRLSSAAYSSEPWSRALWEMGNLLRRRRMERCVLRPPSPGGAEKATRRLKWLRLRLSTSSSDDEQQLDGGGLPKDVRLAWSWLYCRLQIGVASGETPSGLDARCDEVWRRGECTGIVGLVRPDVVDGLRKTTVRRAQRVATWNGRCDTRRFNVVVSPLEVAWFAHALTVLGEREQRLCLLRRAPPICLRAVADMTPRTLQECSDALLRDQDAQRAQESWSYEVARYDVRLSAQGAAHTLYAVELNMLRPTKSKK